MLVVHVCVASPGRIGTCCVECSASPGRVGGCVCRVWLDEWNNVDSEFQRLL